MVLETGVYFYYPEMQELVASLIKILGKALHKEGMKLVITLFLHRSVEDPVPDAEVYGGVAPFVDYFNVMVYDFIQQDLHAPLSWAVNMLNKFEADTAVPAGKLIVGVPFYGYTFTERDPQPMMGTDFVRLLGRKETPIFKWNPGQEEHTLARREYIGKSLETRLVVYPTLYVFPNSNSR